MPTERRSMNLRDVFQQYRDVCMPKNAGPHQMIGTEMAFVAGAESMLACIMSMLGPGEDPTDVELEAMNVMYDDLKKWAVDIGQGKPSPKRGMPVDDDAMYLPCGCVMTRAVIDGEKTNVYQPCRLDCGWCKYIVEETRRQGKRIRVDGGTKGHA